MDILVHINLSCIKFYLQIYGKTKNPISLSDREFVVSNLMLPYKKNIYPIKDGEKHIEIAKTTFEKDKGYMVFVQQKETEYSGIYEILAEKKKVLSVE